MTAPMVHAALEAARDVISVCADHGGELYAPMKRDIVRQIEAAIVENEKEQVFLKASKREREISFALARARSADDGVTEEMARLSASLFAAGLIADAAYAALLDPQ